MPIGPNEAVIVNTHTGAQTKVRLDKPGSVDQGIDQIGSGYIRNDIKQALQARTGGQYQAERPGVRFSRLPGLRMVVYRPMVCGLPPMMASVAVVMLLAGITARRLSVR